jgi:hypothetical protein
MRAVDTTSSSKIENERHQSSLAQPASRALCNLSDLFKPLGGCRVVEAEKLTDNANQSKKMGEVCFIFCYI